MLLFNSRLKIFSGKLKTRWSGPFTITQVFPYGTIELAQQDGPNFKVNGHRLKHYFGGDVPTMVVPDLQNFPKDNWIGDRVKLMWLGYQKKVLRGWQPMLIQFHLLIFYFLTNNVRRGCLFYSCVPWLFVMFVRIVRDLWRFSCSLFSLLSSFIHRCYLEILYP